MALKVRYIDNERVYVFDWKLRPVTRGKLDFDTVQIFKHRDIVKMLNRFLKNIEESNDQNVNVMLLYGLLKAFDFNDNDFMPFQKVNEKDAVYDDEKDIKKTNMPRLRSPRRNTSQKDFGGLKLVAGGLK